MLLITALIPSNEESTVFTGVCLSTPEGGGYLPWMGIGGIPTLDQGRYTSLSKVGPPPPRQSSTASTCYRVGSILLAFAQEDFFSKIFLFVGPLIPCFGLLVISALGFNPGWISHLHTFLPVHCSSDSPLVRHLLTV